MVIALLALIAGMPATGALAQDLVRVSAGTAGIEFQAPGAHAGLVLTVATPDGSVVRQEVKAGNVASFSLFDEDGQRRPDGSYAWEVTVEPSLDKASRQALADARGSDREKKVVDELRRAGKLPQQPLVQSGSFAVVDGAIVAGGEEEPVSSRPRATLSAGAAGGTERVAGSLERVGAADQVIPDDLIVQQSLCVGFDCVNNESFGFDTIRLKENNTRIKFEDTSTGTFPSNDWQLTANDSASGGSNKFSIEDITGAKVPMTITAGASTNSIFVDSTGRVGFRTSTPVLDLHVATSNTPAVRLEQNSSGGFTAQTWDIAGNEANFFVRDVTGGSRLPFRIRPGAPTSSIDVAADGDVGIGTGSPQAKLDVRGSSATDDIFLAIGIDPTNGPSLNMGYAGTSIGRGAGFINVRPDASATAPNPSLRFATANAERMIVTNTGNVGIGTSSPTSKLHVSGGDIRVTTGSFIDDGTTLNVPDYVFEPGYELMPIDQLKEFVAREKHLPNVPKAGDVKAKGLNLSHFQMSLLEKVEELTLYTLAQHEQIGELEQQNAELLERLTALEKLLEK